MPETNKVYEREEASSKAEEPGIGAKKAGKSPVELAFPEVDVGPQRPETAFQTPKASDVSRGKPAEEGINQFAESVATGLKQAGIEVEDRTGEGGRAEKTQHRTETSFLGNWEEFDEVQNLSAEQEVVEEEKDELRPSEEGGGFHSLSEIALASAALGTAAGSADALLDVSSKHDELAEAVQAALLSVYGEALFAVHSRQTEAPAFPQELHASGPGWASEDSLSPQDVILNYFDYQPATRMGHGIANHRVSDAVYDTADAFGETPDYLAPRANRGRSPDAYGDYDGPPSYPVPANYTPPPKTGAADRESSRLLGAAAVGLVGGIAIAASLAVFVISSYGPGVRTATTPSSQAPDASATGYGRWMQSSGEPETGKSAAATFSPELAPAVAASDVMVIPGQPSALAIQVRPEQVNERSLVSITGIPEGSRLNAGVDAGGGNWLLPPKRLSGLTINVPAGTSNATLGVQVLDSNVRTPLSEKTQFVMRVDTPKPEPAALLAVPQSAQHEPVAETPAPPKPAPSFSTQTVPTPAAVTFAQPESEAKAAALAGAARQAAPSRQASLPGPAPDQAKSASRTQVEELIREGNKRMREGDILEARQLYQKAVALGDPEAALAMGRSYDPIYFARIDKKNAEPDAAKAFDWYRKAMDGGAAQTAKVRIENLKYFLNQ